MGLILGLQLRRNRFFFLIFYFWFSPFLNFFRGLFLYLYSTPCLLPLCSVLFCSALIALLLTPTIWHI